MLSRRPTNPKMVIDGDLLVAQIAESLRSNRNLRLLDISFNNMKPKSAMVLANALLDNS